MIGLSLLILFHIPFHGWKLENWFRRDLSFPITYLTYQWSAVVLSQFAVSGVFAVRTMRVTFDQINPRAEDVARTLGCSRIQAYLFIALQRAERVLIAAFTLAWACSGGVWSDPGVCLSNTFSYRGALDNCLSGIEHRES